MGCNSSKPAATPGTTGTAAVTKPAAAPANDSSAPASSAPSSTVKTEDVKLEVAASADKSENAPEQGGAAATEEESVAKEKTEEEQIDDADAEKKAAEEEQIDDAETEKKAAEEEEATAARLEEEEKSNKEKKLKTVMSWRERSKEGEINEEDTIKARIGRVNSAQKNVLEKRTSIKSPVVNSPTAAKNDFDHLVKVVLLGDCNGGKTSLQVRYIQNNFRTWYVSTVGTDLKFKNITVRDSKVKLQVWDTAGKERHIGAAPDFYQKALGYVIVYDVTDPVTFANVRTWMKKVEPFYLANILVSVILVGNKCDCEPEERKVTTEEGQELANEYSVKFFEASAKDDVNVSESLEFLAGHIVDKLKANTELYEDFKLSMF